MSDGQILKPDKDFSKEVDKQLPEAEQLAQVCRYISPLLRTQDDAFTLIDKCSSSHREAYRVGETNKTGTELYYLRAPFQLTSCTGIRPCIHISSSCCN